MSLSIRLQVDARTSIRSELLQAIHRLEHIETRMSDEGLVEAAGSLATVVADLRWQHEELAGMEPRRVALVNRD